MKKYLAEVLIYIKDDLLDPQGRAVERAIKAVGFNGIYSVRVGKTVKFIVEAESKEKAEEKVREVSKRILANPVTEYYNFQIKEFERE